MDVAEGLSFSLYYTIVFSFVHIPIRKALLSNSAVFYLSRPTSATKPLP
jgi:hypothetical protein